MELLPIESLNLSLIIGIEPLKSGSLSSARSIKRVKADFSYKLSLHNLSMLCRLTLP